LPFDTASTLAASFFQEFDLYKKHYALQIIRGDRKDIYRLTTALQPTIRIDAYQPMAHIVN